MVTLNQFLLGLNAEDNEVRESYSNMLLEEFSKSPSGLQTNVLAFIANKLNDESALVRSNIAKFLYQYAKSGRELGQVWINLAKYLGSRDNNVRINVIQSLNYLGKDETTLKKILEDVKYPTEVRMRVAEALAHFYDKKGYLSSLSDLLKKDLSIIQGTLIGIYVDRQLRIVSDKELQPLTETIRLARDTLEHPDLHKPIRKEIPRSAERDKRFARI